MEHPNQINDSIVPVTQSRIAPPRRRGAAVLELAMTLMILLMLAFGTIEFAHYFYVKHTMQGAARQGARVAIVPGATYADVVQAVGTTMQAGGWSSSKYSITVTRNGSTAVDSGSFKTISLGDTVRVTVESKWETVGLRALSAPLGGIGSDKPVKGIAVMMKEG
jgi:Flp pilus assembly protein TadG